MTIRRTPKLLRPVVTLLAESPSSSRRIQGIFSSFFDIKPVDLSSSSIVNQNQNQKEMTKKTKACDELDSVFRPFFNHGFASVASMDRNGTIFHFLSVDDHDPYKDRYSTLTSEADGNGNGDGGAEVQGNGSCSISLLAVTHSETKTNEVGADADADEGQRDQEFLEVIRESRRIIASHILHENKTLSMATQGMKLAAMNLVGSKMTPRHLLNSDNDLPLLVFPSESQISDLDSSEGEGERKREGSLDSIATTRTSGSDETNVKTHLREIVIPFFDEDMCPTHNKTLSQTLSQSNLSRPKIGLYQWPSSSSSSSSSSYESNNNIKYDNKNGIILRPLPIAATDLTSSPPTFVFQCDDLEVVEENILYKYTNDNHNHEDLAHAQLGVNKVGRNSTAPGQIMLYHSDLHGQEPGAADEAGRGIDLRYCQETTVSQSFAEAQESLMAGSLNDLQNVNVLMEGKEKSQRLSQQSQSHDSAELDVKVESWTASGSGSGVRRQAAASTSTSAGTNANVATSQGGLENDAAAPSRVDSMNGLGDCWVEFRANMKQPLGFLLGKNRGRRTGGLGMMKRVGGGGSVKRVAKAPDIPYE